MANEGWIGDLQGVADVQVDGVAFPRSAILNFVGATGVYNATQKRIDLTVGGGGGGGAAAVWRFGTSAPSNGVGVDGDLYLQTTNNTIYKRISGVYTSQGTLTAVPPSRAVNAGAGMTGGGDLTADRTFDVVANADGSMVVNANDIQVGVLATDAQHGARGGGTQHIVATTSVAGFLSAADKTKLDGIATGATANVLSSTTPAAVGTGAVGVGTTVARADHVHDHGNQAGGSLHAVATTSVAGFLSAADKLKLDGIAPGSTPTPLATTNPLPVGTVAIGTGVTAARDDHVHAHGDQAGGTLHAVATTSVAGFLSAADKTKLDGIATGATALALSSSTPAAVGTAAIGAGTTAARSDHVHAHGNQAGGSLHAVATTSVEGFLSAADKNKLDSVASGATSTPLSSSTPAAASAAAGAVGVATTAARGDHAHQVSTGTPVAVGTANADGTATTLARSDHVHALAVATTSVQGALSAADKTKLDGISAGATALSLSSTTPAAIGTAAIGVGTTAARADHVHAHGNQLGGTLHAVATTSIDGFLSATDKTKLDAIAAGATNTPFATSAPPAIAGASALGTTGAGAARGDHTHDHANQAGGTLHAVATTSVAGFLSASDKTKLDGIANGATSLALSSTTPAAIGTAAVGSGVTAARDDHVHAHGNQAGGSLHAQATTSVDGFLSATDKVKLDGIALSATRVTFVASTGSLSGGYGSNNDYAVVTAGTANAGEVWLKSAGTWTQNQFLYSWYATTPSVVASIGSAGASNQVARGDHIHALAAATTSIQGAMSAADKTKLDGIATGATNTTLSSTTPAAVGTAAVGVGTTVARADHVHAHGNQSGGAQHIDATQSASGFLSAADKTKLDNITAYSGTMASVGPTSNAGTSLAYARGDHIHPHGNHSDGANHALATTSVAGFLSAADKTKLDGIALSNLAGSPISASAGVSGGSPASSRGDHTHAVQVGTPVAIGTANADGTSVLLARADHVHALAAATTSVQGAMSAADKTKLDSIVTTGQAIRVGGLETMTPTTGGWSVAISPWYVTTAFAGDGSPAILCIDLNGLLKHGATLASGGSATPRVSVKPAVARAGGSRMSVFFYQLAIGATSMTQIGSSQEDGGSTSIQQLTPAGSWSVTVDLTNYKYFFLLHAGNGGGFGDICLGAQVVQNINGLN